MVKFLQGLKFPISPCIRVYQGCTGGFKTCVCLCVFLWVCPSVSSTKWNNFWPNWQITTKFSRSAQLRPSYFWADDKDPLALRVRPGPPKNIFSSKSISGARGSIHTFLETGGQGGENRAGQWGWKAGAGWEGDQNFGINFFKNRALLILDEDAFILSIF